jgi:protein gp37
VGKNSPIEWTDNTFNPWWGCTKVSAACKHCYAETWAKRIGMSLWGGRTDRRFFGDSHWKQPIRWNAQASAANIRFRVFCASMGDIFESRSDLNVWRARLWDLIRVTPFLDWLLLTKRPEHVSQQVPWGRNWPINVWLGTTIENELWASRRVPALLEHEAAVRFVSCEPLLGPVDLRRWLGSTESRLGIDWVIAGGESGAKARPMNPGWAFSLRDQCVDADVPFHFKQWGNWRPDYVGSPPLAKRVQVRGHVGVPVTLVSLGKGAAGRDLDGTTWDGLPRPRTTQPTAAIVSLASH